MTEGREKIDVLILGAGGAGLMCAIHAAQRGRQVLVLDHAAKLGGKILISGGGRCNFTNTGASPANYVSMNPHFVKSALSRYPSERFVERVKAHGIAFHEKKLGQLFCDRSAQEIVELLRSECNEAGVRIHLATEIRRVDRLVAEKAPARFEVETAAARVYECESLVVATGGLSIPKIGASGLGYELAAKFGLKLVERAPALDGFTFSETQTRDFKMLAGVSLDCTITTNGIRFRENILFTHTGMSGPAALQASLHWRPGDSIEINLLPEMNLFETLIEKKRQGNRSIVRNLLAEHLPARFAERFSELYFPSELPLPQVSEKELAAFTARVHGWKLVPSGTVGYNKAEVTRGGVDTDELSSKTMEARIAPGLFFIGEVVDVTGWLGGYNFQWAWASGWAAAQAV